MKRLLGLLLLISSLAWGQGSQRIGVAQTSAGGYAKILSGAAITVCAYNISLQCLSPVTVYQDPYLTIPQTTPFYADANGNYVYYTSPAVLYLEQVSSPGAVTQTRPVLLGGGASILSVNGVNISGPNFNSSSPSPDTGYVALPFKYSGDNVIVEFPNASPPVLGGTTPNVATFSNLTITGTCTGCGSTNWASPGAIGSIAPNTGAFTALTSTGGALNGSIGSTTPAAGTFALITSPTANLTDVMVSNLNVTALETLTYLPPNTAQLGLDGSGVIRAITTYKNIEYVIDGGGTAITTGSKGYLQIPFAGTIQSWVVLGDQSGSIQVDIKTSTYAAFPSTASIVGGNYPTLTGSQKAAGAPTSWTTAVPANQIFEFYVNSATTVQRVTVVLNISVP